MGTTPLMPLSVVHAAMNDYCLVPPYVKRDVKPNVLVDMDNSEEMGGPAYCIKDAVDPTICTDNYNPNEAYDGYYEIPSNNNGHHTQYYCYSGNRWVPKLYSTAIPAGCVTPAIYNGNLLNWATMSKYDLLQRILVGGISTSRQTNVNVLVGESVNWTKTLVYTDSVGNTRSCKFIVSGGDVEITDSTPGSCGYLDPAPLPLISFADPARKYADVTSMTGTTGRRISSLSEKEVQTGADNVTENNEQPPASVFRKVLGLIAGLMDFLASPAEAAKPVAIKVGSPPDGTECIAYTSGTAVEAAGGTTPYTWTVSAGSLPPGLSLLSGTPVAVISGSPTQAGTYSFTLRVQDAAGVSDTKAYSMTIADNTVTIETKSPLQEGYVNSFYQAQTSAAGACNNFTWTLDSASPALPAGFSFNDSGNVGVLLNGNPTIQGTFSFIARVTDSSSNVATKTFTFTINPALVSLTVASGSPLTSALQFNPYFVWIESAGGAPGAYSWSISNGTTCANNTLPPGLTFNTVTTNFFSSISGIPTASGTFCFVITVTDSLGATATKEFTFTVTPQPAIIRTMGRTAIRICAGIKTLTKDVNCDSVGASTYNTVGYPCSATYPTACVMKSGIIDEFWSRARFGLMDFNRQAGDAIPSIANCIEAAPGATPDENFLTAVENAVPIAPVTTLVNASYTAANYYATNTAANCDPFRNATACMKNFVLYISSGSGADNPPIPSGGTPNVYTDVANCGDANYKNFTKNTCYAFNNDLRTGVGYEGRQYVTAYVVNPMGTLATPNYNPNNPPATTGDILKQAAMKGGGVYYEARNSTELKAQLSQAFQDILKRAAAGTAASVLASGEGSGANLLQAVFYPRLKFEDKEIAWIGRLSNFWFYVDPFFAKSTIRVDDGDKILDLRTDASHKDYITEMYYDPANEATMAKRWEDTNGNSIKDTLITPDIPFERMGSLWEAGLLLWDRNLAVTPRAIKTSVGSGLMDFSFAAPGPHTLRPYLDVTSDDEAEALIRYLHGYDDPVVNGVTYAYRDRTVSIDVNGNGTFEAAEQNKVWKLGDVLNSTPKVASWIPLNTYHRSYRDTTYGDDALNTGFIYNAGYASRGMTFAGANDGMLHAFKLGELKDTWVGQQPTEKARLDGSDLGKEMWAFIPQNVLPYLKYIKQDDYCHIYSVDLTPLIFDASVKRDGTVAQPVSCTDSEYWNCQKTENSWRTILVGGMRYGGACRNSNATCANCVKAPGVDINASGSLDTSAERNLGNSSYFALDITDQNNPLLLWEWNGTVHNTSTGAHENHLGFTTSGAAVVKINARRVVGAGPTSEADTTKNGRWFVVVGSGPTGPISTADAQFLGRSDQNLRIFIMDAVTGPSSLYELDTNIPKAFAGSMLNANDDVDLDYQDDAVYIPYVKSDGALIGETWTRGGVVRLLTREDLNGVTLATTALDPANWTAAGVIDDIGPVTSAVVRLHNMKKKQHWLYLGEGRYFFEQGANTDDATNQRRVMGFKDPCYEPSGFNLSCTSMVSIGSLVNVTNIANVPSNPDVSGYNGWYINMDAEGNYTYSENDTALTRAYRSERVITDPVATKSGLAFFTTYKPYNDECALGGKSFIWAAKYDTGGAPGSLLKGKGIVQVSTGSIEQIDLSTAFTDAGGRKTTSIEGVPPTQSGLSLLSSPPPVNRVIHFRER